MGVAPRALDHHRHRLRPHRLLTVAVGAAVALGLVAATSASALPAAQPQDARGAAVATLPIPLVQGRAHLSPYAGQRVRTSGVVTAAKHDGYWIQDLAGDGDDTTSDGVFVFVGAGRPRPDVGSVVDVTATVDEYRPGDRDGPNLQVTELVDATVDVVAADAGLPEPVVLGPGGRLAPPVVAGAEEGGQRVDAETAGRFDPRTDALAFYESLEGMRVALRDAVVVGPTNDYGELVALPAGTPAPRTEAGGVRYDGYHRHNTARVTVDDEIVYRRMPAADVGDRLPGAVDGPLHYDYGTYRIYPDDVPTVASAERVADRARPARPGEVSVAAFNVENLDPTDPPRKFARLADQIVDSLAAPDILALEEVQDNTGPECPDGDGCVPDGVVAADETLERLIAAVEAAGGPAYDWREIAPVNLADGGEPTGNIRNAFLFRTDRGLDFVDRPGGDATTATRVGGSPGRAELTLSPGRVEPTSPAFADSRKPLAAEFRHRDRSLIVVALHLSSKGGDEPQFGRWQPPDRATEPDRHAQAAVVRDFVRDVLDRQADAAVVVLGDVNDFEFSRTVAILEGAPDRRTLRDLPAELLEPDERYTYVFQGNSQVLDHILVSPALWGLRRPGGPTRPTRIRDYDVLNINADFADQASDHDPQVVTLRLPPR